MWDVPFQERKTVFRGILDVACGCYPRFMLGGSVKGAIPIFHFHDVSREYLEPYFQYLAENDYKTLDSEDISRVVRGKETFPQRSVALCFDDAWASLWAVVFPLLKQYNLQAITYVSPSRIDDAVECRPQTGVLNQDKGSRFASWAELVAMHKSGLVDIQAHTLSHSKVFCSNQIKGFLTPETKMSLLSRPALVDGSEKNFLSLDMLGYPLYAQRSRYSDALRFLPDKESTLRCCEHVSQNGKSGFFERENWRKELIQIAGTEKGRFETEDERKSEIRMDLTECRKILELKLEKPVRHICMPWAVCGKLAESLAREVGYETVVADDLFGKRFVHRKTNPYRIMRLKHQYIYLLPGRGRKSLIKINRNKL